MLRLSLIIFIVSLLASVVCTNVMSRLKQRVDSDTKYAMREEQKYFFVTRGNARIEVSRKLWFLHQLFLVLIFFFGFLAIASLGVFVVKNLMLPNIKGFLFRQ